MRKILWALISIIVVSLTLTGCMGKVVDVTIVVENATEYELKWVVFNIPQSSGTYSPMKDVITADDAPLKPGAERETAISFVDSDFGNSGGALIGLENDGSSKSLTAAKGEVILERGTNRLRITHDGEAFIISAVDAANADQVASPAPESGFDFSVLSGWEFEFTSGAGGWMTVVYIEPDGTFSGEFHDSEMGSAGEDYPDGTIYVCNFTGRFTAAQKISEYEYSMKCVDLAQDGKEGEEEIIDGIRYITSTPYGFDNADEFRLYLPGKLVSELPAEYVDWVYGLSEYAKLDFYGLYNISGEQGFSSYQNDSGETMSISQAEHLVIEATKDDAQSIEANGGKPAYVYSGEGEIGGSKARFFDLGTNSDDKFTAEHHFSVNEDGDIFGLDIFGDWHLLTD
jgi:hypothetical protein